MTEYVVNMCYFYHNKIHDISKTLVLERNNFLTKLRHITK